MGAREHVFNLIAGIDVPVGNIVLLHRRNLLLVEVFLSLTDNFHDFERSLVLNALQNQIVHDVVSGRNNFTHRRRPRADVILCVIQPHIRAVRKA